MYPRMVMIVSTFCALSFGIATAQESHSAAAPSLRQAQQELKNDGYYKGRVDGIYGPLTRDALVRFQHDNGLKATGRLDKATAANLRRASSANAAASQGESAAKEGWGEAKRTVKGPGKQAAKQSSTEVKRGAKEAKGAAKEGVSEAGSAAGEAGGAAKEGLGEVKGVFGGGNQKNNPPKSK